MSYSIFITGTINIPKGTKIPKKFKPIIAAEPYGFVLSGSKKYDRYYITMSVSSCLGSRESLKSCFADMAKELKAFSVFGVIVGDNNPEDYIYWRKGDSWENYE